MSVSRERWAEARPLFEELADLDDADRQARLNQIGESDPQLKETLESLLQFDRGDSDPLRAYSFGRPGAQRNNSQSHASDPLRIVGQTISHFRVTGFLAAGGMGVVYRAEDLQLARAVALKFPAPHQQITEDLKERFVREARAVAGLDHPNLCSVYEIGETPEGVFLAMPFYEGETLKDRLAREHTLSVGDVIGITRKITTGLSFAHAAGIIHRDLKPGNIMLLPDGSVKILDFGLAKVRDASQTRSRATLGTVTYMAPEQIRGDAVDGRADLWAIGVMLYEMLTGTTPFRGDHELTLLHAILHSEPTRASRLSGEIPRPLDQVITSLLQKDRSHRYQSAEALLKDLDAIESGGAVSHRIPLWTMAWQRKRIRVTLIVACALVSIALFGLLSWRLGRSDQKSAATPSTIAQTLAVVPFISSEPESTAYLVAGLPDGIVSRLSMVQGLRIAGQFSAATLQRQGLPPRVVGQRLGVAHVLEGNARVANDSLQASIKLLRVADDAIIWSRDFKAPLFGILSLQQQVADSILSALQLHAAQPGHLPTNDTYAYDLYLKARYAWEERTREKLDLALGYYRGAVERDPRFALAYAAMAEAYVNMQNFGYLPRSEGLALADAASAKAIAIDTTLAEAYTARGQLLSSQGRYREAENFLRRAIELDPGAWSARHYYSLLLMMMGRFPEAKEQTQKTLSLDPLSVPGNSNLAIFAANEGKWNEAEAKFDRAQKLGPNYVVTLYYFGALEAARGHYEKAATLLEKALKIAPNFTGVRGGLALTYMHLGRRDESRSLLQDARARISDERSRTDYALALAILGQTDSAFSIMQTSTWDIPTVIDLRTDPLLQHFRADPRYAQLIARLNLQP
jgi:serine/threonine protein kinase/Flp pilus assembly protein TadD